MLPEDYNANPTKRYPVIYFMHGFRYYKDLYDWETLSYEKLDPSIRNKAIFVAPDGWFPGGQTWNEYLYQDIPIAGMSDVAMRDYIEELIAHVDSTYRTIPDRNHRGFIGQSMGGGGNWLFAALKPQLTCVAMNFVGTPEAVIGGSRFGTLWSFRYAIENFYGVKVALQNTTMDELHGLNWETDAAYKRDKWVDYYTWVIDACHSCSELDKGYQYILSVFDNPPLKPPFWDHQTMYPAGNVWGYDYTSNKTGEGYLIFRHVTPKHFRAFTSKWQPDGPVIDAGIISVTTDTIYTPNAPYMISKFNYPTETITQSIQNATANGKLSFSFTAYGGAVGITGSTPSPVLGIHSFELLSNGKHRYLQQDAAEQVTFKVYNLGTANADNVTFTVTTPDPGVTLSLMPSTIPLIAAQSMTAVSIGVQVNASAPPEVRFDIAMSVNGQTFYDTQYARVWYNAPAISVVIDDGKKILSNSIAKGIGNGNGIAEPGEEILIARQDSIEMKLFTEDPYVDITQEKLYGKNLGAPWNDGYTTFSRVKIADNAPVGHQIVFLGRYDRKPPPEYDRAINWGTATITIHQAPGYKSK